ncbi:MAG TPA: hypothetical protein VIL42_03080 [Sphingomicrobium sp.]|jgi:hypothetical protein
MTTDDSKRKSRAKESAAKRSQRLDKAEQGREAGTKADDANVQRMIERSIKDHGA